MAAISSFGTLLKIGDGATSEAFTTIANVSDISGPSETLATAETTSQTSASNARTFIGTVIDGGEVTFSIFYEPAGATHDATTGLQKDLRDRTVRNFQLVFPDSGTTTWTIAALVTNVAPTAPVDGALTADVTLKVSGLPSIA